MSPSTLQMTNMPKATQNRLLGMLSPPELDDFLSHSEFVTLRKGEILTEAGQAIDKMYYLTTGLGAVVLTTPEGNRAEAGLFGFDGYIPSAAISGTALSVHEVSVQIPGTAYSVDYEYFTQRMDASKEFSRVMLAGVESFAIQLAYTAVSNAVHDVSERLARWLLMCHDRMEGDEILLTHDALSLMLGVRRPSVTTSLHVLEGNGFIRSERGVITIRNRPALEEFASDAYGKAEREILRLLSEVR